MNRILPFDWLIALRFLAEGRMQTAFILGGISIGVGVIVFMLAMLSGLQGNFVKRVLTSQAHIQLLPPEETARPLVFGTGISEAAIVQRPSQRVLSIDQWQTIRTAMQARGDVETVSPTVTGSALALRGEASRNLSLIGIEPETYLEIVRLPDYMVSGQPGVGSDSILIGTELAKDLGVSLGDKLNVTTASGTAQLLTISGIFDLGNKGSNARVAFVALRTAQSLLHLIGGATTLDITVADIYAAETIAVDIASAYPVQADSWIKTNAQFFTAVQAQNISSLLIRVFVGLSVAFGIAAVLVVTVIQRSKDIGILRAMGTARGQILRIFLIQGGVLGFLGSLFGSGIGYVALVAFHALARQADGSELFPITVDLTLFASAAGLATITGLAAALAPAMRASGLDPVEAIRG